MFKGVTYREFNKNFRKEEDCRQYLFDLKFKKNFRCRKCNNPRFKKGKTSFHARCTRCNYDESYTAHTIFHKIQIPLTKAFSMAFQIAILKKGISTMELGKLHGINQKTAWTFKRKVQSAMGIAISNTGGVLNVDKESKLDSITLKRNSPELNGLQRINLVIQSCRSDSRSEKIVRCKSSFANSTAIDVCHLNKGRYIDEGKDIRIWNFKIWLTGVHHHCTDKYLQGYLDEFFFRYNFRHEQETVWHRLIKYMVRTKPGSLYRKAT